MQSTVKDQLNTMQWELLEHAAYSLDFTLHDFVIFGPLKKALEGHNFMSNDDVQVTLVCLWGISPSNNLQTGYAKLCKSGTPV